MKTVKRYELTDFSDKKNIPVKLAKSLKYYEFLSKPFILKSVKNCGESVEVWYHANNKDNVVYLPPTTKVIKLSKIKVKAIVKSYEEYILNTLPNVLIHNFHIGSDPEIFVEDGNGNVIPAFNFLNDKKNAALAPTDENNRKQNKLYWDGFQAEFETEANNCLSWQMDSIKLGLEGIWLAAKAYNKDAKLLAKPTVDIPFDVLQSSKEEHVAFGCMPSFNVYGLKGREINGREVPFRSCGGHLHFGCGPKKEKDINNIIKALDAIIGVACVSLFANFDDAKRRLMYGLAGEYRTPPHGLEYRTLSNAWLYHPLIANIVIDVARKAFMFGEQGLMKYWKTPESETIECIQNCDVKKAREIMELNKDMFIKIIQSVQVFKTVNPFDIRLSFDHSELIYNIFYNGMEYAIKEPTNIEKNWDLGSKWIIHCNGIGRNFMYSKALLLKGEKV